MLLLRVYRMYAILDKNFFFSSLVDHSSWFSHLFREKLNEKNDPY